MNFAAELMQNGGMADNLSQNQCNLLHAHYQLLHMGFAKIQQLACQGLLPKNIAKCKHLICLDCQFGKPHHQSIPLVATTIDAGNLHPGDCISCDQLESNTPGMIPTWKGKPTIKHYKAVTIFINHASRFIHLSMCESTGADEAILAKLHFEKLAKDSRIQLQHFWFNNGVFASNSFKLSLTAAGQDITFCRVNAHFQNWIAKHSIRTIIDRGLNAPACYREVA